MSSQLALFAGAEADITSNRHRGSEMSVKAFSTTPKGIRRKQRREVLNAVELAGLMGLTTFEVSRRLGIKYTSASARMSELKRDGKLENTGLRRPTDTKKGAAAWRARR